MTEQDALEAFFAEWDRQANEYGASLTREQRDCAEEAWHAALAWVRSQGEPVGYTTQLAIRLGHFTSSPKNLWGDKGVPLYAAPQPAWRKVDDEIESGVGIRWVSDTGIHGRPTAHDVREYLERRGESAKCGCDKCTAPQPAIPDGWQLVPKELTGGMLEAAIAAGWSRIDIYQAMIAAAPEPSK